MIRFLTASFLIFSVFGLAQSSKKQAALLEEGKMLYRSEMTSWYGTDAFLAAFPDRDQIGGYFSYIDADSSRCIFYNRSENPVVLGTISFQDSFSVEIASVNLQRRVFSETERVYYALRIRAVERLKSDTIFKHYKNTSFNIIPIITKKEKKVYYLTGPNVSGVVIFGNDYLLTFDKKGGIKSLKRLHNNIIWMEYKEGQESSMHSHNETTGDYMTATDICTLMLYGKITGWTHHVVVSKKYQSFWNCKTQDLFVLPTKTVEKIHAAQEADGED
jgi:hypothetical protein